MKIETKNEFTSSNKDNIGIATILAVSLLAVASGVFASKPAVAYDATPTAIQKLDTIIVTAPRAPDTTLETIVVTASRNTSQS